MINDNDKIKSLFEETGWLVFQSRDYIISIKKYISTPRILVVLTKEEYNNQDILNLKALSETLGGKMSVVRRRGKDFLIDVISDKYTFNLSKKKRTSSNEISKKINSLKNKISHWD